MKQLNRSRRRLPLDQDQPAVEVAETSPPTGSEPSPDDFVGDVLRRVIAYHHLGPAEVAARVEVEVRRDWGGERPYIAKIGESLRAMISQRNERIRSDHRRGDHVELLARRHHLTIRRINQILAA